ncbi:MAG: SET domain-containing protein [Dehalococcoidia bacterium]
MEVSSYISPKARKGQASSIQGRGLFAVEPIAAGEIVAIKGGHIIDRQTLREHAELIGAADIQIADGLYLAPLTPAEVEPVMMYLNHSCEPNVGIQGNIVFVAMRDVAAGEELVMDYAMFDDYPDEAMTCRCGTASRRGVITGKDWQRPELQEKYGPYFSAYLLAKMRGK